MMKVSLDTAQKIHDYKEQLTEQARKLIVSSANGKTELEKQRALKAYGIVTRTLNEMKEHKFVIV